MIPLLLVTWISLTAGVAEAAERNFCRPPTELTFTTCEENSALLNALNACMKKIDRTSSLRGLSNLAATDVLAKTAESKQRGRIQEANTAQNITLANLQLMINDVKLALNDIDGYFDEIVLPEDAEMGEGEMWNGLNLDEISNHDCYTEPLFALDEAYTKLESDLASLEGAKLALEKMEAATSKSGNSMESLSPADLKASPAAGKVPAGPRPKGKDIRKSDISGTEEEKSQVAPQK